ncbi:MAG: transcriptional regulator [Paenibacillus sp.]|jgi:hypothetical protein|nr:transcriptional regulator [Paenibacillus sp.]
MTIQELIDQINWAILAPIFAIQLVLVIIALIDCIRSEQTKGPKWLWILIIIFVNIIGPIVYFVVGRGRDR